MKLSYIFLSALVAGCVHAIPMGNHQRCASQGLVLDGVDLGSAESNTVTPKWNVYTTTTATNNVHCVSAKIAEEKCKIDVYNRSLQPGAEFNEHVGFKNLAIGAGYCLFLVPGIFAYSHFDSQRDEAFRDSIDIIKSGTRSCERETTVGH